MLIAAPGLAPSAVKSTVAVPVNPLIVTIGVVNCDVVPKHEGGPVGLVAKLAKLNALGTVSHVTVLKVADTPPIVKVAAAAPVPLTTPELVSCTITV